MFKVKKSILLPIMAFVIIGICIGGYFLISELVTSDTERVLLNEIFLPETTNKGEPLEIVFLIELKKVKKAFIQNIEIGISSETYNLNDSISLEIGQLISGKGKHNLTVLVKPLLNVTTGFFALNVGEYSIFNVNIIFDRKVPKITKKVNMLFQIINSPEEEQVKNGNFDDGINEWIIEKADNNLSVDIIEFSPLSSESLHVFNDELINPENSTWITMEQTINLTKSHYLSFDLLIEGNNCSIEITMAVNNAKINMSLYVNENSTRNQLIYFGEVMGEVDIIITVLFVSAKTNTEVYLDNFSILQYEHVIFVFMLNDNWETVGETIERKNLFLTINETSDYFERKLGIKLLPILELGWHPHDTSMSEVDLIGLEAAGEKLGLEGDWDIISGRSIKNHGFDLLTCFSNQTSEHFGFAYYERNIAFHFAQSEELGDYSVLTIVEDWAENLVQHEISHNFGALDRDRLEFPSSVMSKPSTPDQVIADFKSNKLWLQVNNWLLEDILLMLRNIAMFD